MSSSVLGTQSPDSHEGKMAILNDLMRILEEAGLDTHQSACFLFDAGVKVASQVIRDEERFILWKQEAQERLAAHSWDPMVDPEAN